MPFLLKTKTMFTPAISFDAISNATVLRIIDITGPDTGAGTKWDGVSGVDSSLVSAAEFIITDPNGDVITLDVKSILSAAHPITGNVSFPDQVGQWVDGYYDLVYNIYMVGTSITKFEDYSGTVPGTIKVTSVGHLLTTGMKTVITGTTNYNGTFDVTKIDADTFYITGTFVSDDATGNSTPLYSHSFLTFVYANASNGITRMYQVFSAMQDGNEADDYLKQCNTAFGLLQSLINAYGSASPSIVNNIYGRVTRILDYNSIELQYT